ncbi:MAG: S8 family serine peptidase [Pirellulales bacterium]|nr:S8 family serine peptidase [Pirellulales bacterium]
MQDSQHRGYRAPRALKLETFEERLAFSVQPVGDFRIDAFVENSTGQGELQHFIQGELEQFVANGNSWTGLSQVRNDYGLMGTGQTVVVIDSGIAYDHTALGGGYGANYRVVGGWDFAENDANPYDDGPAGGHGTHVAGIIGSSSSLYPGVAPGVDLVGLRVFNDQGAGYFSWVESALRWVHQNRNSFENPITTVNLSLGSTANDNSTPSWAMLEDEFALLRADGIFISVAAGNAFTSYNAPGLSYPGSSSNVVPVASADDNGALSYFSQRNNRVIVAPGRSVMSTVPDYVGNLNGQPDDFARMSGTSMAAPYVAAASVLIREAFAFGGNLSVSQDEIYSWMRNTADTIFDSATNQNYLRLNLDRAIDSLMPGDDVGSTAGTAQNLGSLLQNGSFSGTIGRRDDRDYFRFTAGQTGRLTIDIDVTHYMQTSVELVGGGGTYDATAGTFTFDVVAGQSYTIGLGTTGGVGHYTASMTLVGMNAVNLGTIEASQFAGQSIGQGNNFFSFTAARDRFLTVDASFLSTAGNIDLRLYNSSGTLVGSSQGTGNFERIDCFARAGDTFYLEVIGTNANVNLRVTNLVAQNDGTVYVFGAATNDVVEFSAGSMHEVVVNGVSYSFNSANFRRFDFRGGAGIDTVVLRGTAGAESAELRFGGGELSGNGFNAQATGFEFVTIDGRGGWDRGVVYDTPNNDTVVSTPGDTRIYGPGYENRILNFEQLQILGSTGVDVALLYDSAGDDTYISTPDATRMYGIGYEVVVRKFDAVRGLASTGFDRAFLYDSAGNDTLTSWPIDTRLQGTGHDNAVRGFDTVRAFASGGVDRAVLNDSAGNDTITAWPIDVRLQGAAHDIAVRDFEEVEIFLTTGNDVATFHDSVWNDSFYGSGSEARLTGVNYSILAHGLDEVWANATQGGTNYLYLSSVDYLFHQSGNWV